MKHSKRGQPHPLFIRYTQSPLKSVEHVDEFTIKDYVSRIHVDEYNYILTECFKRTSQHICNQSISIKRYLINDLRASAFRIIRVYSMKYHVNCQALIYDNCLYHYDGADWLKIIKTVRIQLHTIHHYPNFRSLRNSKFSDFVSISLKVKPHHIKNKSAYKKCLKQKIPLHEKIQLLHIPLAKHARIKLAPLREGHKHYAYQFSATRGKWFKNNKWHPFGPEGSVLIKKIHYQGQKITNHMWVYGHKNLRNLLPMSRGTRFCFSGWVAKYLKHHDQYYDYRINHIRNVRIIKDK